MRAVEFVQAKPVPIAVEEAGVREFETELVSPGQYVTVQPPTIAVEVAVAEQIVTREFAVAVEVRGAAHDAALAPDKIELALRGPKRLLDALDADAVSAYVDAAGQKPGVYLVSPQVDVPEGAEVAQQLPAELRLELTAPEKQEEGTKAEQ